MGFFGSIGKALGATIPGSIKNLPGVPGGGSKPAVMPGSPVAKPLAGTAQGSVAPAGPAAPAGPVLAKAALLQGKGLGAAPGAISALGQQMAQPLALASEPGLAGGGGPKMSKMLRKGRGFRGGKR